MDHSQSRAEGTPAEQTQMDLQKSEDEPSAVGLKAPGSRSGACSRTGRSGITRNTRNKRNTRNTRSASLVARSFTSLSGVHRLGTAPGFDICWIDFAAVLSALSGSTKCTREQGGKNQCLSERLKQSSKRRHRGGYTTLNTFNSVCPPVAAGTVKLGGLYDRRASFCCLEIKTEPLIPPLRCICAAATSQIKALVKPSQTEQHKIYRGATNGSVWTFSRANTQQSRQYVCTWTQRFFIRTFLIKRKA